MAAVTPGTPVIVIRAKGGWRPVDFRELLSYRELLLFFVWRDLKLRYKQTALGALWAVVQPVGLMVVLTLVLGRVSGLAATGVPYPLFALAALVPWTLISQGLLRSSESLVNSANMVQKVYFPRLLLPLAAVGLHLVDYLLALAILGLIMAWFGTLPTLAALWVLPLSLLAALVALAGGVWLSALNVRYRDVRAALPFLVQLWLFASPIAYDVALVPERWRPLYELNPVVGVIQGFRWALIQQGPAPFEPILVSVIISVAALAAGLLYFTRVERTFADVI